MEKFSNSLRTNPFTLSFVINLGGFPMKDCVKDFYDVIDSSVKVITMLTESELWQLKTQLLFTSCFKLMKDKFFKRFYNTLKK